MANPTPSESAPALVRAGRGLRASAVFLILLLLPAGLYAFYVMGQIDDIRAQNLQRLDAAASATRELLADTRNTVKALYRREEKESEGWSDGCTFFQRQARLTLIDPADCKKLPENASSKGSIAYSYDSLQTEVADSSLQFRLTLVNSERQSQDTHADPGSSGACPAFSGIASICDMNWWVLNPAPANVPITKAGTKEVLIEVRLDKLLKQIPFGEAFDLVMIIDEKGAQLGRAIRPARPSAMRPPGVDVPVETVPVNVLSVAGLSLPTAPDKASVELPQLDSATVVQPLEIAGRRFDLMCQPMRPDKSYNIDAAAGSKSWHLCGLVDKQRVFRQALSVAPYISVTLLALLILCVVSSPVLKLISVSPLERVRFYDFHLMLVSTLTLTMLLTIVVADVTTHLDMRERSYDRLKLLADDLSKRLHSEISAMYEQLELYDALVAGTLKANDLKWAMGEKGRGVAITRLLKPEEDCVAGKDCAKSAAMPGLTLPVPTDYPALNMVYWMRPCDGQQIIKASALNYTTPAVSLDEREYFRAVKSDRLWHLPKENGNPVQFYAETASSISTGEFFAVVSTLSRLTSNTQFLDKLKVQTGTDRQSLDCFPPEDSRFAVALTSQLESLHYPVLAPGVGYAIVDAEGGVLMHSDERRSLYDNLLKDTGIASRLRAVMEARTSARLYAQYQTRSHQLFITPIGDLPWFVVTFVDDEVLRTLNIEVIIHALAPVIAYLVVALLATLIYLWVHGRNPPLWIWPRRDPRLRPLYLWTLWGLGGQLALFLLSLSVLQGWVILVAMVVLPLPTVRAVTLAASTAERVLAESGPSSPRLARQQMWLLGTSAILAVLLYVAMSIWDPVSASFAQAHRPAAVPVICVFVVLMLAAVAMQKYPTSFRYRMESTPRWLHGWRDPLAPHIACTVLVWLLVGALPAYGFFKFALQEEVVRWMQLEQSYVGGAQQWRDCGLRQDDRQFPAEEKAFLESEKQPGRKLPRREKIDQARNAAGIAWGNALYPDALLLQSLLPDTDVSEKPDDLQPWRSNTLSSLGPVYNEMTTYARYLERPLLNSGSGNQGNPAAWSWQKMGDGPALLRHYSATVGSCGASPVNLIGRPHLQMMDPVIGWWGWLLGLPLGVASLYALASYCVRKLLFGDIEDEIRDSGAQLANTGIPMNHAGLEDLWTSLSAEERLLLYQLAKERFANPKQADLVRQLLQRGLLRRDPVLRLVNDNFAAFVLARLPAAEVQAMESGGVGWHRLRGILLTALVLLVLFLTLTQRDTVELWVAYLGTAAAGAAGIFKLLGMLKLSGEQSKDN